MSYNKFKVLRLETTLSGTYAIYTSKNGDTVWTSNFGFKAEDIVEWWNYDGYCPTKIILNGAVIWTEEDRKKWWKDYNGQEPPQIQQ